MNDRTKIEAGSIGNIFINKRKAACCDPRAAKELGFELSAFQIMPKLFYPMLLLVSSLIAIFGIKGGDDK